jgi:uncharacterized protein YneF (UPF0154 family)
MSTTTTAFPPSHAPATARPKSVSWTIWAGVLGVTSSTIGGAWDVAWHRSIGRDSFLTPAHIAIYMCGVVALFVCAYLIFYTTFGPNRGAAAQLKAESVHVLGFRAPLGAFIAAWGGIAMLTSAPFDNWWHAAYGLDVKIISPPHTLLILGIRGIAVGILFLIIAAMNRARGNPPLASQYKTLQALFLYMGRRPPSRHRLHGPGRRHPGRLRARCHGLRKPLGLHHHGRHLHGLAHRRNPHLPTRSRES